MSLFWKPSTGLSSDLEGIQNHLQSTQEPSIVCQNLISCHPPCSPNPSLWSSLFLRHIKLVLALGPFPHLFLLPKILSPKSLPGWLLLVINFQFVPCLIQETPDHIIKIALNHNFIINYLFLFIIAFRTAECFPVGVFMCLFLALLTGM